MKRKPILCLDFDGTVHWFRHGWHPKGPRGATVIDDEPVPGAQKAIRCYLQTFDVQIFSSRSGYPGGIVAMMIWLEKWKFPSGIKLPKNKPNAHVYLDDRGWRFDGFWPDPIQLLYSAPWYED